MILKKKEKINQKTFIQFRDWRLRSQILVIQLFFVILSTAFIVFFIMYVQQKIIEKIVKDSLFILQTKIMSRQSINIQQQYIIQLLEGFQKGEQSLYSLQVLFDYSKQNKFQFQYDLENCNNFDNLIISKQLKYVEQSFCACYGIAGESLNKEIYQDKLILANLLNQVAIMQKNHYQLYFSSNSADQFYSIVPCQYITSDWIPKQRPWYQYHNQNSEIIQVSDVYLELELGICFTQTKTLQNLQKQSVGILANDITMSQFILYDQFIPVNFTVVDKNGRIMLSSLYMSEEKDILYFYNTSKIGYDQEDYKILLGFQDNIISDNICPFEIMNTFCLFNQIEKKVKYISTDTIAALGFLIIAEYDPNLYVSKLDLFYTEIKSTSDMQLQVLIGILIIALCLIIASFFINTVILQKPLEKLLYYAHIINKSQRIKQIKQPKFSTKNIIGKLNLAFFNFLNQQNQGKEYSEELLRLQFECGQQYFEQKTSKKLKLPKNIVILYNIISKNSYTFINLINLNLMSNGKNLEISELFIQKIQLKLRQIIITIIKFSENRLFKDEDILINNFD